MFGEDAEAGQGGQVALLEGCMNSIKRIAIAELIITYYIIYNPCHIYAQLQGDRELIKMVAMKHKGNYDSIMTWSAKVMMENSFSVTEKGVINHIKREVHVEFKSDRVQDKYFYKSVRYNETITINDQNSGNTDQLYEGAVVIGDIYYKLIPYYPKKSGGELYRPGLIILQKADVQHADFSPEFDPYMYFKMNAQEEVYSRMMFLYDYSSHAGLTGWSVAKKNNYIIITWEQGSSINRHVFDINKGSNLVEESGETENVSVQRIYDYVKIGSVWVPHKTYSKNNNKQDGKYHIRKTTWSEHALNREIPDSVYAFSQLGLKSGDLIRDARTGINFPYDESADLKKSVKPGRFWTTAAVLGLGGAALLIALLGLWLRRRKRRRADHAMA